MDKFILLVGLVFLMFGCGDEATGPYVYTNVPTEGESDDVLGDHEQENGGGDHHPPIEVPEIPEEPTVDGAKLYGVKCAGCHGSLENSSKRGKSDSQIKSALGRIKAMRNLVVSDEEITEISKALKK